MLCTTVKTGVDCALMTKAGCGFNGGACNPVVDTCEGCQKIKELPTGRYCASYPNPAAKWKTGNCNFATHIKVEKAQPQGKVNPIKASKRGAKGK
jgi:hypothetical protein